MINLTVGKHKCSVPNKWDEITIKKYAEIVAIIGKYKVKEIDPNADLNDDDDTSANDQLQNNIKSNKDIFKSLTGLDESVILQCDMVEMDTILRSVMECLNDTTEFSELKKIPTGFSFKGKDYDFPKPRLEDTTFGEYIEAEQLKLNKQKMDAGRFGVMAEQMAILCKEDGIINTEDVVAKRSRLFEGLPMSKVWGFVFFLMKASNTSQKSIATYLKMELETKTGTLQKIGA